MIAIIGAGITGLTLANQLSKITQVTVFEKSHGVGGRMATRRADDYQFDHGAQFFHAKTHAFQTFIEPMLKQEIIARWDPRFVEINDTEINNTRKWNAEFPHYVGVPGMSAIGKYLASDLDIRLNTKVYRVEKDECWQLFDDHGNTLGVFDWVILTAPVAHSLTLLPNDFQYHSALAAKKMTACYSLMLGFKHPLSLIFDAAFVSQADISWVSVNHSKPGRSSAFTLVVHSTNAWADAHLEDDQNEVQQYLINETSRVIQMNLTCADHIGLHRWHYANIAKQTDQPCYIDTSLKLAVCGDWCIQGRIESAFTSACMAGDKLKEIIG